MPAASVDLIIEQGATFEYRFTYEIEQRDVDTGSIEYIPVDLSGYTARMQVREEITDPTFLIELTTENGMISMTDAADGAVDLIIPSGETELFEWTRGYYDLELEKSGKVIRFVEGVARVKPEVTR